MPTLPPVERDDDHCDRQLRDGNAVSVPPGPIRHRVDGTRSGGNPPGAAQAGPIQRSRAQPGRAERLAVALDRDGRTCVWCGRAFGDLVRPTTDHLIPRVKGGPSWPENEIAACRRCNGERGHRSPADWLEECRRRGWQPDLGRIRRALEALERAIDERGGQRRARPYLAGQLRRTRRIA